MTKEALSARAVKAARTRAEKRAEEAGAKNAKRILLVLDEALLSDFDKSRKKAHDTTITAGIRHAMQDYIREYRG